MDLPSRLLQKAIMETDDYRRVRHISDCIKTVSSSLMYRSRSKILLSDEMMYYYLFLCLPFSPTSIERLLNSVLYRFQDNFKFYTIFGRNLVKIFEVEEMPGMEEKDKGSKSPNAKPFTKKFVDGIYSKLINVKTVAFEYFQKLWEMSNEKVEAILSSRDYDYMLLNPINVAKVAISKTDNKDFVSQVHTYVVSIRNSQLFAISTENIIEIDKMLDEKVEGNYNYLSKVKRDLYDHDDDDRPPFDMKELVEEFLLPGGIPELAKKKILLDYFSQDSRNLAILFYFIIEPHFYTVSKKFMKACRPLEHLDPLVREYIVDHQAEISDSNRHHQEDAPIDRSYNIYKVVRAFQAFLCLVHEPNYVLIMRNSPNFVNQFYSQVANVFKKGLSGMISTIVKLIEYFILKNPVESVKSMVSYNIFSFFVSYISLPKYQNVRHLFTCLIDPSDEYLGLAKEIKILLWKHCRNSGHIMDLISLMVNPLKGLLSQEGYLEKNIEAKILIDEVDNTNLLMRSKYPLGLRMFNFKLIDLDNEIIWENLHSEVEDIDQIKDILGYKMLMENKKFPATGSDFPKVVKSGQHKKSGIELNRAPTMVGLPTTGARKTLKASEETKEFEIVGKEAFIATRELGIEAKLLKITSSALLGEDEQAEQEQVIQLLHELATQPEDQPKIRKFIDFYFNELVHKELKTLEELSTRSKVTLGPTGGKGLFLHDYLHYLRSQTSISYTSYGWREKQLDGSVLGEKKVSFYPCKVKTTNSIDVNKIEDMIGVVNRQVVLEQEETTKDIAAMIYQLVKGASMVDGKYSFVEKTVTNEFWDSFFQGNLIDNFEKIYLCFLVKIEFFMDNNYVNSSVYYFGEIVNHLLERTAHQDDLYRFKGFFTRVVKNNIGLFKSVFLRIFDHFKAKAQNPAMLKFQKYLVRDPLGIQRLQFSETLIYFLDLLNPTVSKFDEEELTTILQVLFVWLIEKKYHSIYLNKMVRLLNTLMEPRHQQFLVNVLLKLNMVSILHDMYFAINPNDVLQTIMLADQSLLFIRVFVNRISHALKKAKPTDTIASLNSMNNWLELKHEIKKLMVKSKSEKKQIQQKVMKFLVKRMTANFEGKLKSEPITPPDSSSEIELSEEEEKTETKQPHPLQKDLRLGSMVSGRESFGDSNN